jgi:hypothetical protein
MKRRQEIIDPGKKAFDDQQKAMQGKVNQKPIEVESRFRIKQTKPKLKLAFTNTQWDDLKRKDTPTISEECSNCEKVHLKRINASDQELINLFKAIGSSNKIKTFEFSVRTMGEEVSNALMEAINKNKSIQEYKIYSDLVQMSIWDKIEKLLGQKGFAATYKNFDKRDHFIKAKRDRSHSI